LVITRDDGSHCDYIAAAVGHVNVNALDNAADSVFVEDSKYLLTAISFC
jgi:hypothetical protein